jgi:membrane protein involved in colicin uptake
VQHLIFPTLFTGKKQMSEIKEIKGKKFEVVTLGAVDIPSDAKGAPIVQKTEDGKQYEVKIYRNLGLTDEAKAANEAKEAERKAAVEARKKARAEAKAKREAEAKARSEAYKQRRLEAVKRQEEELAKKKANLGL